MKTGAIILHLNLRKFSYITVTLCFCHFIIPYLLLILNEIYVKFDVFLYFRCFFIYITNILLYNIISQLVNLL